MSGGHEVKPPMLSLDAMGQLLVLASQASADDVARCMTLLTRQPGNPVAEHEAAVRRGMYDDLKFGESLLDVPPERTPMTEDQLAEAGAHARAKAEFWSGRDRASLLDVLYVMTNCFDSVQLTELIDLWTYHKRGMVRVDGSHMTGYWGPLDAAGRKPGAELFGPDGVCAVCGGAGCPVCDPEDEFDPETLTYDESEYLSPGQYHDNFEPF